MIMTEKEASDMRCCEPFIIGYEVDHLERLKNPVYEPCIGSKCPAWWWYDSDPADDLRIATLIKSTKETGKTYKGVREAYEQRRGYCGKVSGGFINGIK